MKLTTHVVNRYLERVCNQTNWTAEEWVHAQHLIESDLAKAYRNRTGFEYCGVQFVRRWDEIVTFYYN